MTERKPGNQPMRARPDTIRRAIENLEAKKPRAVEHKYNRCDCREDDQRCLETLRRLLS